MHTLDDAKAIFEEVRAFLATKGLAKVLRERAKLDPDRCILVDMVCSAEGTGAGRALLGQLIVDAKRKRRRSPEALVFVAVSDTGSKLLASFGFEHLEIDDDTIMYRRLDQLHLETFTDSALTFRGSDRTLDMYHGLPWAQCDDEGQAL